MTPHRKTSAIADEFSSFASDPANKIGKLTNSLRSGGKGTRIEVSGLAGGSAFLTACIVCKALKTQLIYISDSSESCHRASEAIGFFTGEKPAIAERSDISFLARVKNSRAVCSTVETISEKIISPSFLKSISPRVKTGDKTDRDEFIRQLAQVGYKEKEFARLAGEISVRGAVIDIMRAGGDPPLRVEFSGNAIRSVRLFDPQTQISTRRESSAQILPVSFEQTRTDGASSCVFDHCGENPVVFFENRGAESIGESLRNAAAQRDASGHFNSDRIEREISRRRSVVVQTLNAGEIDFHVSPVREEGKAASPAAKILNSARRLKSEGYKLKLFLKNDAEIEKMAHIANEEKIDADFYAAAAGGGFVFPDIGTAFIDEGDFTAAQKAASPSATDGKFSAQAFASAFADIEDGDFIVHREFGVGIFRGLKNLTIRETKGDFIECEYHGGDNVYVPVSKFKLLHGYIGGEDGSPRIDKLGSAAWKKTVKGAKRATEKVAKELLELYADRSSGEGRSFSKPDAEFRQFEMDFMFEETPDQAKAIEDVMRDMESPRPMDRLICGDTGFGKTEVALRAALKAAMDGVQVVFMAPTTLLVSQHLKTARKRLEKFPVKIVAFSRFNSPGEEKIILSEIERGTADIIIGTHKLLGAGGKFKSPGLLIIDEEHRFGVKHKEKLKTLKKNLDVLSLSATPIPRTLQLSLAGIRDISSINSPPHGRLPVQIRIKKWNEKLIHDMVLTETRRGGGIFFIHNRIENIDTVARRLKEIVPGISMEVTHGKMGKKDLERKIEAFARGEIEMLVTTTIVESGLDITRANTIIVNNAHTFGIADLYQLKGRVGRGEKQAFACFLVPEKQPVSDTAWKRLERFSELWNFGSGYHLAFSDMQMRGMGNLFGVEQSGHVAGVGVEFYLEMLRETVENLKTGTMRRRIEPEIKTKIESRIPKCYVTNGGERLVFYKRISSSSTIGEVNELKREIRDRFGPLPVFVQNLLALAALKTILEKHSAALMEINADDAAVYRTKDHSSPMALFSGDSKGWKILCRKDLPATVATRVARVLSSLKPVLDVE